MLTIHGRGFQNLTLQPPVVRVGGVKASDVAVRSDTVLTCTVPPGIGSRLTVRIVPRFALLVPGPPSARETGGPGWGQPGAGFGKGLFLRWWVLGLGTAACFWFVGLFLV